MRGNDMLYKVGDKVLVRRDLNESMHSTVGIVPSMVKLRGKIVTIKKTLYSSFSYLIEEDYGCSWEDMCFEPIVDERE